VWTKSEAGNRTIPINPLVVNTLREWHLVRPKGDLGLLFPNGKGRLWDHVHIVTRFLWPTMVAAGVVDDKGELKYPGLHALRHFYASWWINRKADGGLELPVKSVQERLGHALIMITSESTATYSPASTTEQNWPRRRNCCSPAQHGCNVRVNSLIISVLDTRLVIRLDAAF